MLDFLHAYKSDEEDDHQLDWKVSPMRRRTRSIIIWTICFAMRSSAADARLERKLSLMIDKNMLRQTNTTTTTNKVNVTGPNTGAASLSS